MSRKKRRQAPSVVARDVLDEPPPLARAQLREIKRRVRDLDDRTRYLLASVLTPKHTLYYNVSEDTFGMDTPRFGTLFKRRAAAEAIQDLLRSHARIVVCRVNRRGSLVIGSVPRLRPDWHRGARVTATARRRHA